MPRKKAPRAAGLFDARTGRAPRLVAVAFPVVMNAHFVAFGMVMFIRLSRSDRAKGGDSGGNGEDNFFHYKILKSTWWY
jgi:hypothetical protein